jgi:dimeric dUTPase (all-alpha-NTP-PPase superfamily)
MPIEDMPKSISPNKEKLNLIFKPDMFGATIAYLESQIGPAKRISDYPINYSGDLEREYQIGPCTVKIYGQNSITSFELVGLSPECSFDISSLILVEGNKEAYRTTFGYLANFDGGTPYEFYSECINICNVPQDPKIHFIYTIAYITRFLHINASISVFDDNIGDQFDKLTQSINDDELTYIDDQKYAPIALDYFKDQKIQNIKFE